MRNLHNIIIAIVAIVTIGMVGCTPTDNLLGSSPQRTPQSPEYSDYIISPEEAIALAMKDAELNDLWDRTPSFESIETVIVEDLLEEYNMLNNDTINTLFENGIMMLDDPAYYIVNFAEGGYAVVLPNRNLDVTIPHTQNYDSEPSYIITPPIGTFGTGIPGYDPIPWLPADKAGDRAGWVDWAMNIAKALYEYDNDITGDIPPARHVVYSAWEPVNALATNANFFPEKQNFNNPEAASLGKCWQVLFSFLGFWENPNTLFGQTGDWATIKNDINTDPALYWAMEITNYCEIPLPNGYHIENPYRMFSFLIDECSGAYPNASIHLLGYDKTTNYSDISHLLSENKPVIMIKNLQPFLAKWEIIYERIVTTYCGNEVLNQHQEYKSEIRLFRGKYGSRTHDSWMNKFAHYIDY